MTSRELVNETLRGKNTGRAPRQLWTLPWATARYAGEIEKLNRDYPADIISFAPPCKKSAAKVGSPYELGDSIDDWGCKFHNIHEGVHGEVKEAIVKSDDWSDAENVHIPEEWLTFDIDNVNAIIKNEYSDKFTMLSCTPRPFEQLQFIRGTENLYMDLLDRPENMLRFIEKMHDFYCRYLTKVVKTNVDAIFFMDDWGSQNSLLINPKIWEEIFMPMYKDYIDIAHKAGKKAFMHSDGNTLSIIPKLIEIGLDAFNCQIFCMGLDCLKPFKGKITFWGEIDRQNLLPNGTCAEIDRAVKEVYKTLWKAGYCIAQCEFGPSAKPENVYRVYKSWDEVIMGRWNDDK